MKNKGFTLIELLSVIAILAVIGLIITLNFTSTVNDTTKANCDRFVEEVENAACVYAALPEYSALCGRGLGRCTITIESLQEAGLLDAEVNSCNSKPINLTDTVTVTWDNDGYKKCYYNGDREPQKIDNVKEENKSNNNGENTGTGTGGNTGTGTGGNTGTGTGTGGNTETGGDTPSNPGVSDVKVSAELDTINRKIKVTITGNTESSIKFCISNTDNCDPNIIKTGSSFNIELPTNRGDYYIRIKDKDGKISSAKITIPCLNGDTFNQCIKDIKPKGFVDTNVNGLRRFVGTHTTNEPNNYISLGGKKFRIIGIVETGDSVSTTQGMIKVIAVDKLTAYRWDGGTTVNDGVLAKYSASKVINNVTGTQCTIDTATSGNACTPKWSESKLQTNILNQTYLNSISGISNMIQPVGWRCYVATENPSISSELSSSSCVNAKIGLIYISDYLCSVSSSCSSSSSTGWISNGYDQWTISSGGYRKTNSNGTLLGWNGWIVAKEGIVRTTQYFYGDPSEADGFGKTTKNSYPAFYLKSNVKFTSGTGTSSDPFVVSSGD